MSLSLAPALVPSACSTQLGSPSPSLSRVGLAQSATYAVRNALMAARVQLIVRVSSGVALKAGEAELMVLLHAAVGEPLPEQVSLGFEKRASVGRQYDMI